MAAEEYIDRFGVHHAVLSSSITYVGLYDNNQQYETGDVALKNGELCGYFNEKWVPLEASEINDKITINKCPNCEAPVEPGKTKCSYCDSWFRL